MTIRMFFTILAVLSFLFGIGFVLAPVQVLANYGIQPCQIDARIHGADDCAGSVDDGITHPQHFVP